MASLKLYTSQVVHGNAVYGFKNRVVHDYGNVEPDIVYETLKNDIPDLIGLL